MPHALHRWILDFSKCGAFLNFAIDMTSEIVKLLSYTMKFQNRLPAIQFNVLMVEWTASVMLLSGCCMHV